MADNTPAYSEIEKSEVRKDFIKTLQDKFKTEEAEGICFTLGNYISNYDFGIIFTIDNGTLSIRDAESKEEIEKCDIYLHAELDIYRKLETKEIALSELMEQEGEALYFGGDMGLIYELYNIFDLPA